jgi:hypothetical protein
METENSYKASAAALSTPYSADEVASKGRRFGTFVLDHVFCAVICAVLGALVASGFGLSAVEGGNAI